MFHGYPKIHIILFSFFAYPGNSHGINLEVKRKFFILIKFFLKPDAFFLGKFSIEVSVK